MGNYHKEFGVPGKNADELYEAVSDGIERFLGKLNLSNYSIDRDPDKHEISVDSRLVKAVLSCADAQINLEAKLSFLVLPFRSKLDEGLDRWLTKTFKPSSP